VRREFWGYAPDEHLTGDDLIQEKYRGVRPGPRLPRLPRPHRENYPVSSCSTPKTKPASGSPKPGHVPASSVSGLYYAHPDSRYFGLGRIGVDQVADIGPAQRHELNELERWLMPNLNYEPK
jgi:5-methyltetrahydrofolate--homocysteine methyltransferase